jgi:hypothetical protein
MATAGPASRTAPRKIYLGRMYTRMWTINDIRMWRTRTAVSYSRRLILNFRCVALAQRDSNSRFCPHGPGILHTVLCGNLQAAQKYMNEMLWSDVLYCLPYSPRVKPPNVIDFYVSLKIELSYSDKRPSLPNIIFFFLVSDVIVSANKNEYKIRKCPHTFGNRALVMPWEQ